jgi:hypothetical protein
VCFGRALGFLCSWLSLPPPLSIPAPAPAPSHPRTSHLHPRP